MKYFILGLGIALVLGLITNSFGKLCDMPENCDNVSMVSVN